MTTAASLEEIAARAEVIYRERIAPQLGPDDDGKLVVVDVDTGAYEIGDDEVAVSRRARAAHPEGTLHMLRVGSGTVGRIGAK